MEYDETKPVRLPRNAIQAIQDVIFPSGISSDQRLQLLIGIEPKNAPLREIGAYLSLVDRLYGRLDPAGLLSYSHTHERYLRISTVRPGSTNIIISVAVEWAPRLTLLFIVLKCLPGFLRGFTGAYRDIQESRLARERRRQLRAKFEHDPDLSRVPERYSLQIVETVDHILTVESPGLSGPQRFSEQFVKSVRISLHSGNEEDTYDATH